jgi:hypothetical protein
MAIKRLMWVQCKECLFFLSSFDYILIAISFASSFFGAFGKELADQIMSYVRRGVKDSLKQSEENI